MGVWLDKKVVVAVTGSVACFKVCQLVHDLAKAGAKVHVAMSKSAQKFVGKASMAALSGNPVVTRVFGEHPEGEHLNLARGADLLVVAPASANSLGKFAFGLADDLVSTLFLTVKCPVLVAPAMHAEMWQNALVKRNVAMLKEAGINFVGPVTGDLASGDIGEGRMADIAEIKDVAEFLLTPKPFLGKRVLLSVGPTYEEIDSVRYISNYSSGSLGRALARDFYMAGAQVSVVSSLGIESFVSGVKHVAVKSALDMQNRVRELIPESDIFISNAAVADVRPKNVSTKKLSKGELRSIELEENPDILASVRGIPGRRLIVGFALSSDLDEAQIKGKIESKGMDICVAVNDKAFGNVQVEGIIFAGEEKRPFYTDKQTLAEMILSLVKSYC